MTVRLIIVEDNPKFLQCSEAITLLKIQPQREFIKPVHHDLQIDSFFEMVEKNGVVNLRGDMENFVR